MVLEFQPYFQPDRNRDRESLSGLNQTIGDIGDTAMRFSQQQKENKIRDAMLQLQQQQGQREQGAYNYEYGDPNASGGNGGGAPSSAPSPSGSLQNGTTGPQPMSMPPAPGHDQPMSYADNMPTSYPQMASAGTPDMGWPQGPQPMHQPGTDLTAHFNAWQQQGQPQSYNHPQMGSSQSQEGTNPDDPYNLGMSMARVGQKRYMAMEGISKEQAGGRLLAVSPIAKSMFGGAKPEDLAHFGDQAPSILEKGAELQSSQNYKNAQLGLANSRFGLDESKFGDTKLEQVQKAYSGDENVKKAQGTLDKVTQAIPLLQSGQIDNATAKQALTTAMTYMSTGGQRVNDVELKQFGGAQTLTNRMGQWVKGIDAGTLTSKDASDMAQVLGYFQKAAQQNIQQAGMRYAKQLSQRTGERPEDAYKRVTGSDFTQGQNSGGGQQYQSIKRNPKTGQTIGWDGKQWQIIQQ